MSKRVVSLLLTLLLAVSVCIPVFATTVEPADQSDVSESAETEETAPEAEEEPSVEEPEEETAEEEPNEPEEEPEATSEEVDEVSQKEIETIAAAPGKYYVELSEDKTKLTLSSTKPSSGEQFFDWWECDTNRPASAAPWQSIANKASVKSVEFKDSISNLNGHQLFSDFTSLETVTFTAKVTFTMTINEMFKGCTNLKTIEEAGNFDVSSVTNMRDTFNGCKSLEVLDLSSWNTSKVSDLTDMFEGCKSLTKLNISGWDTTSVTYEVNLFDGCLSLRELTVGSSFKLNADHDTNEHQIHDPEISKGSYWIKDQDTSTEKWNDNAFIKHFENGGVAGTYYWVHEIWYDVNGDDHGVAPIDDRLYKYGESATLLDKGGITEKDQEVFIGWSEQHKGLVKSEAEAQGVKNPGDKVEFTDRKIDVYAVFAEDINRNKTPDYKENRVTVTFDINDGDGSKEDEEDHKTTYTVENLLPGTPLVLRVYYTLKWTKEWTKDDKPATHPAILAGWTTDESVAQDIILENDVDPDGARLSEKLEHRYNVVVPDKDTTYYAVYAEDENGDETMDFLEDSLQVEYYANGGQHIHGWVDHIEGLVFRCMHHHVPDEDGVTLLSVDLGKQWVKRDGAVLLGWAEQPTDLVTDAAQETAAKIVTSVKMPEKENKKVYAVWAIDENGNGTPDYEETATPEEPEPKPTPSAEPKPTPTTEPEPTPSTAPTPTPTPKPDYGIIPDVPWYQYQPEDEGEYVPGPDEVTYSFPDVDPSAWYAGPVGWAAQSGVTAGYPDGNFHPDDTCTRAQIVTFLWKAAGTPMSVGSVSFSDVEQGSFYYDAAVWAANSGIIAGYPDGNFHPDDPCTRAQIVAMLYRYANSPAVSGESKFFDVDAGAYYYSAAIWAEQNGIVAGYPDGGFHPDDVCTRAQIVTMLYNYIKG